MTNKPDTRTPPPQEAPAPVRAMGMIAENRAEMRRRFAAMDADTRRVAIGEEPTWDELHSLFDEIYERDYDRVARAHPNYGSCYADRCATLSAIQTIVSRVMQCERTRQPTRAQAASAGDWGEALDCLNAVANEAVGGNWKWAKAIVEQGLAAPTDVAAYRQLQESDAERLVKQYTHQRTQWDSSVIAMLEAMKDIHAVIRIPAGAVE